MNAAEPLIVPATAWRPQPWKNGGGTTYEIARGDDTLGFTWRLSLAHVEADGPFSLFPGVDRTIALIAGAGFTLRRSGETLVTLTEPLVPFAFSGDDALDCTLVCGPVRDLNLMVRRDAWRGRATRLDLERGELRGCAIHDRLLVFVAEGTVRLRGARERSLAELRALDTAVFARREPVTLEASATPCRLVVVSLDAPTVSAV